MARHRAPEARQPHLLQRVVVRYGARRLAVADATARRVGEPEAERLLALVDSVVADRHVHRLRGLTRGEGQRPARRRVVLARRRRAVRSGVVHRHRVRGAGEGAAQAHLERDRRARALVRPRVRHRDLRAPVAFRAGRIPWPPRQSTRFARRPKDAGAPDAPAETMAEPVFTLVSAREPEHRRRQRAATDHGCGARAPRRPQRGQKSTLTVTQTAGGVYALLGRQTMAGTLRPTTKSSKTGA